MSRLPATSAENLANELHRQLVIVEFERDEAIRERDEAQAVIDAVRDARLKIVAQINGINGNASRRERTRVAAFCRALRLLDEVDGL